MPINTSPLARLLWFRSANLTAQPVLWHEALDELNLEGSENSWRLPTINELESLVDCASHRPDLPSRLPFSVVQDIYWSSTTSLFEPDWAWALYLEKGATGFGQNAMRSFRYGPWQLSIEYISYENGTRTQ